MAADRTGSWIRTTAQILGVGAALGIGALAYATVEAKSYTLRRCELPVLPAGSRPIKVLHLSDFHMLAHQKAKQDWISGLAGLEPDLVINTGDNHADAAAWPQVVAALGRLLDVPGVFVHGSNDYLGPRPRNWLKYLAGPSSHGPAAQLDADRELPWRELDAVFTSRGWHDLTHEPATIELAGQRILFRGTDDAHLNRDNYATVAGPRPEGVTLQVGVTHAPYLRVLDAMVADGCEVIFAGHTHGGQVCIPGYGALTTNCDLDTPRVKGPSVHVHGDRHARLHVSAGLGTSPYAPIRFACRPEATLLRLVARETDDSTAM